MLTINLTAFFTNKGVPATGLSPTIDVRRLDTGALVVTAGAMAEIGGGFYSFDFTSTFDASIADYVAVADGGATLSNVERYKSGSLDESEFAIDKIRKVTTNRALVNATDTLVTIFEDDGSTPAFSFTINATRRDRTPV